jgi:hypothetical protein
VLALPRKRDTREKRISLFKTLISLFSRDARVIHPVRVDDAGVVNHRVDDAGVARESFEKLLAFEWCQQFRHLLSCVLVGFPLLYHCLCQDRRGVGEQQMLRARWAVR